MSNCLEKTKITAPSQWMAVILQQNSCEPTA